MTNLKTTLKIGLAASLLSAVTAASATTVNVNASATVDNAVDLTVTGDLGFGTIRASIGGTPANTECQGLQIDPDTTVTTMSVDVPTACGGGAGTSEISSIDGTFTRPEFSISGVPAFTTLTLTEPTDSELTLGGASPPDSAVFELIDFTAFQTNSTPAADVDISSGSGDLVADVNGEVTFTMGATLSTDVAAGAAGLTDYQDAAYSGSFDVTVTY